MFSLTEEEKKKQVADVNGVIELRIKQGEHEASESDFYNLITFFL